MLHTLIHLALLTAFPPLMLGVINKTKAAFAGRVGPPVLQPYRDLFKLVRKGSVFSSTTSLLFRLGPIVGLVSVGLAGLLIPLGHKTAPISFSGDLLLFAYLLGLARFFTALAALDTGSAFEGMGAAREVTFACLAEPILFFGLLVLAKVTNSAGDPAEQLRQLNLATILGGSLSREWGLAGASMVLILANWFIVLLVENCRIPFDDPNTHLELTMIHEVMVLDHSGPLFGLIMYGASLKLFISGALVIRLAVPLDTGYGALDWGLFVASLLGLSVLVGVVESVMARLRMPLVAPLLVAAGVLSAFALVLTIAATGNGS